MADSVLIRGGGEMATGVAAALHRAGYRVAIAEAAQPRAIRRTVAFATAIYSNTISVENITARHCTPNNLDKCWADGVIPVIIDESAQIRGSLDFSVVVDAILSKTNSGGTCQDWAPLVIGLGPGFRAGADCHLVVETQRGHDLGRYYAQGACAPNTGTPGDIAGVTVQRLIRAPATGKLQTSVEIGSLVSPGMSVASVDGVPVTAAIEGVLRGLMPAGSLVTKHEKIGDVDPRGKPEFCNLISDKARHIGLGTLAAILWHRAGRPGPLPHSPF